MCDALGARSGSARTGIPLPLSSVYAWGSGISTPLRLPMLSTEVVQVSAGRTQKAGVTKSGRLVMWEVSGADLRGPGNPVYPPLTPPLPACCKACASDLPVASFCQAPPMGAAGGPSLPGAVEQLQPQFVSRFLEGQSGVTIKHVSCGDLFSACLTGMPRSWQ